MMDVHFTPLCSQTPELAPLFFFHRLCFTLLHTAHRLTADHDQHSHGLDCRRLTALRAKLLQRENHSLILPNPPPPPPPFLFFGRRCNILSHAQLCPNASCS